MGDSMGYYVSLPEETLQTAMLRYRKSGIWAANSCINTAHNSAVYLFPIGTSYTIFNDQGKFITNSKTTYSYWEDTLNLPIPNFASLKSRERAYLFIPSGVK
jgi:hypothetical protein